MPVNCGLTMPAQVKHLGPRHLSGRCAWSSWFLTLALWAFGSKLRERKVSHALLLGIFPCKDGPQHVYTFTECRCLVYYQFEATGDKTI